MNGLATLLPAGDLDPAYPASTCDAAVPGLDRPAADVAGDVMTPDPDRVAGSDTLMEVAGRMRTLLVAFLPVCDQHGDLQGIIALRDLQRAVRGGDPTGATAFSLAQEPPVSIGVDDPVCRVWDLMAAQQMWLLPVLDARRLGQSEQGVDAVRPSRISTESVLISPGCSRRVSRCNCWDSRCRNAGVCVG